MHGNFSRPQNLSQLFIRAVKQGGERPAISFRRAADKSFTHRSWRAFGADVATTVDKLLQHSLKPGDRVAQLSENRYEWVLLDLACHLMGCVHVALHATQSGHQVHAQLENSGSRLLVVSTAEQANKLQSVKSFAPQLNVAAWNPCRGSLQGREIDDWTLPISSADSAIPQEWPGLSASPDSLATILYTSGTSGNPKGVMLTHGNLVGNACAIGAAFAMTEADHKLCWLPLSHIFARTCDLYAWLAYCNRLTLAVSRETVLEDCRQARPSIVSCVPYFLQKLQTHVQEISRGDCLESQRASKCDDSRESASSVESLMLKATLGGRIRALGSGGAALLPAIADWYLARGVPVLQGYGLSETSPVISACTPTKHRSGSVGPLLPDVQVRFAEDGELLTKGPHVMLGYWNDPQSTAEAFVEGWFKTGDLGRMDEEGFLWIVGRKKELIVLTNGKKASPTLMEGLLLLDPWIAQVMVLGDNRKFLAALIVPDVKALAELARQRSWLHLLYQGQPCSAAFGDKAVRAIYQSRIDAALSELAAHEKIGQFELLEEPFSVSSGELTPKLSLCRPIIESRRAAVIEALYGRRATD